jgi:hypothetical protein
MARHADASGQMDNASPALVGLAAWALPGLGHWLLGQRSRAIVLFVTIMLTYWTGIAVGGIRYTVDLPTNALWFVGELGAGPQVVALYLATMRQELPAVPWPDSDIAIIYAGVAGLLNMLVIQTRSAAPPASDPCPSRPGRLRLRLTTRPPARSDATAGGRS